MKNLFKLTRLSLKNRPSIKEQCFFSPCIELVSGVFIDDTRKLLVNELLCTVTRHGDRVEHVKFRTEEHIVSPEFLLRKELTKYGKTVLGEQK